MMKKKPYSKVNNKDQQQHPPLAAVEEEEQEEGKSTFLIVIGVTAILLLIAVASGVVAIRRLTSSSGRHVHTGPKIIARVCYSARFPETCAASVGAYTRAADASTPRDVVAVSMIVGFQGISTSLELVERLYAAEKNDSVRAPLKDCLDLLSDALDQMNSSIALFLKADDDKASASENADIRTWLSSALTLQDTCADDEFRGVVGSAKDEILSDGIHVQKLLSNSLSLVQVFASLGNDLSDWKKKPSRNLP
ncbi:hypothetical protein O6H91_11G053700 [Diphasiastrum complanatum]|uniref:Uncharacterized protein n=1 Tax=Diphasiastrum complanatum TaxID=34168 RepID=A0ACC2C911_DIPCM|nr:hypothetical protein O6H91_11G053700 [Diphasiastrum complanatum]